MTKTECERYLGNTALVIGRLPDDVDIHMQIATNAGPTIQIASNDRSEIHFDYEHYDAQAKQTVYEYKTQGTTIVKIVPDEEEEPCEEQSV